MAVVFRNLSRRDCSAISVGAAGIAGASTCFLLRLTRSGRFCLRQMSASSIVATPHCGACSFSDDLTSDGISATGCPQRFAPLGHLFPHSPLGSSLASVDLRSDEVSATGSHRLFAQIRDLDNCSRERRDGSFRSQWAPGVINYKRFLVQPYRGQLMVTELVRRLRSYCDRYSRPGSEHSFFYLWRFSPNVQ